MITTRDRLYLRAIFLLNGSEKPVGPLELSRSMDVSKEGAYQEMKRIEKLGFGKYLVQKGIIINKKALEIIEKDVKRHHLLEKFLQKSLDLSHDEACKESSNIDQLISEKLMEKIGKKIGPLSSEDCICVIKNPLHPDDLRKCHWIKKTIKGV